MTDGFNWGYELLLDIGPCNSHINDPETVKEFVTTLVKKLDMHPLGKPQVVYVDTEEGKGVSAVQIITTSTITFHGDANGNVAFIDVFSCKLYDPEVVIELVNNYFSPKNITKRWLTRNVAI
jgi:S-adenosylmethionine/arginine decarboxylase-like enzyme